MRAGSSALRFASTPITLSSFDTLGFRSSQNDEALTSSGLQIPLM